MTTHAHTQNESHQLSVLNCMGVPISDDDRLITSPEVVKIAGVSKATIYRMCKKFQFPLSQEYTPGVNRWWLSEVKHWSKLGCGAWYEQYGKAIEVQDQALKLND